MLAQSTRPRLTRRVATLSSALALATMLAAAARAQTGNAYNAPDPTVRSGSVTFDRTSVGNQETYTVASPTAVLDFVPNGAGVGPITFQAAGTNVIYQNAVGNADFTVLNRIVPTDATRAIEFDGRVVSRLQNAAGAFSSGGTVWFYSPGGILVGPGAVMDVGNLLLSTGDPTGGTGTISSTSTFTLNSAAERGISIDTTATIVGQTSGGYVALVAPIVQQSGTVNVNGAAAYVAAEQATLTFNSGLFDITVPTGGGSSGNSGRPFSHIGSTNFTDTASLHRAYLVAVPKNDAITMVIQSSGNLGFTTATAVNIDRGAVILSAGYNVQEATAGAGNPIGGQASTVTADLEVRSGLFNADTNAIATRDLLIQPFANAGFARDLTMQGSRTVTLAGNGTALTVGRNLLMLAPAAPIGSAAAVTAGSALLTALNGGSTTVTGNANVSAGAGSYFPVAGATGAATGGTARIDAAGGNVTIGGNGSVEAGAFSFTLATGGTASFNAAAGRTLSITGQATASAQATGYNTDATITNNGGGNATGGTASAIATGTLSFGSTLTLTADATGGAQTLNTVGFGGAATGGSATISVGTAGSFGAGAVQASARGTGGASLGSGSAGTATGGTASLVSAGSTTIAQFTGIATGTGGTKSAGNGGAGSATAGNTLLSLTAGTTRITGSVNLNSIATGGTAAAVAGGTGGSATSGDARIVAQGGGALTIGQATVPATVFLTANATGGAGNGPGGNATARTVSISQGTGGRVTIAGSVSETANAVGGASGVNGSSGGRGIGGDVRFVSNDGTIAATGAVTLSANGTGGTVASTGGSGGLGQGGLVNIGSDAQGTSVGGTATLTANGTGGAALASAGAAGQGGTGTGGQALIGSIGAGTLQLGASSILSAGGTGGASAAGTGGTGTGGTAQIFAQRGTAVAGGFASTSTTGTGGSGPTAGAGTGGSASFAADAGTLRLLGGASADATGYGGTPGTTGGSGTGGIASFFTFVGTAGGGGRIDVTGQALGLASGYGVPSSQGLNALGGAATGGNANVTANGGAITFNNDLQLFAVGRSGYGSNAALLTGRGGTAAIAADGGNVTVLGATTGDGSGSGAFAPSTGLVGGSAFGGGAFARVGSGFTLDLRGRVSLYANADGGASAATGVVAGAATAGTASLTATGTLRVGGDVFLYGDGRGGARVQGSGVAGAGNGGTTQASAPGGTLSIAGGATLTSTGIGGGAGFGGSLNAIGDGGAGTGGTAQIFANGGGTVRLTAATALDTHGDGGASGSTSGTGGTGGGGFASLAANGGTIVGGTTTDLFAAGTGGAGFTAGGLGAGGGSEGSPNGGANITATNGAVDLTASTRTTFVSIFGAGGDALTRTNAAGAIVAGGGAGGAAQGGAVTIGGNTVATGSATQAGRVLLGDLTVFADSTGGDGAAGAPGQAGGAGGSATSSGVAVRAFAGNGVLQVGELEIDLESTGGAGGAGGAANAAGVAGAGGRGGDAAGGFTNAIGTASGPDTAFNLGAATFGNVSFYAAGVGGAGGDATGAGAAGGAGGTGRGGSGGPLSRGAPVTFGDVNLNAQGIGGDGGVGTDAVRAAGGTGYGGAITLIATNRFNRTERGSITAGAVLSAADGIGGLGPDVAAPAFAGISQITVTNADATLASFTATGIGSANADFGPSLLSVSGGTLALRGALSLFGGAPITFTLGNGGTLQADTLSLFTTGGGIDGAASTGVLDIDDAIALFATGDIRYAAPIGATLASTPAGSFSAQAGGILSLGAVRAGGDLSLSAGSGSATAGAIESAGGSVSVSGNGVTLATVRAGNGVELTSGGALSAGDVTAGTLSGTTPGADPAFPGGTRPAFDNADVAIQANGDVALGNVTGQDIDIDNTTLSDGPYGNIAVGSITGEYVEFQSGGTARIGAVATRNLFSGDVAAGNAYAVELGATRSLTVGDIASGGLVALASQNGTVAAGNVTTPSSLLAFAATDITLAGATTGRGANDGIYLGNASQVSRTPALAALLSDNEVPAFDPAVLATLTPVRVGGAITITGRVSTGSFRAAAANGVRTGDIDAGVRVAIDSGNTIATGAILTPAALSLTSSGAISTGSIQAADVTLTSGGAIATGSISSGDSVVLTAGGTLSTGAIVAGTRGQTARGRVALRSAGALRAGAIVAPGDVAMIAQGGAVQVDGAIQSGANVALLASNGIAAQAITGGRGAGQFVLLAGAENAQRIAQDGSFPADFASGTAAAVRGPIAVSGAIRGGLVRTVGTGTATYGLIDGLAGVRLFGGATSVQGAVTGPTIELTATDIIIGQQASLAASQNVTISALGFGQAVPATVGGTAQGPGFTLDAAEIARVRGGSIAVGTLASSATANDAGALLVHDLTLSGGGGDGANLGTGGTLTLAAAPGILVDGTVRLNNATTDNALVFSTAGSFRLATDQGSIGVFGSGGALGGRLAITADDISVGTAALLARANDFEGAADIQPAVTAIGAPASQPRPEGYVQANRIELTGTDYIVIQNSGSRTAAAGFTAGSGGMSVTSRATRQDGATSTGGLDLVIYGRVANATGFAVNEATRDAITFSSGAQTASPIAGFSSVSQVNGCLLTAASCLAGAIVDPPREMATVTVSTDVLGIVDGALASDSSDATQAATVPSFTLVSLIDAAAITTDATIDDPVTGGGNASLWVGGEDALDGTATGPVTGSRAVEEDRPVPQARKKKGSKR